MPGRHLPIFRSLAGYDKRWLRGDLIAGLTVWAVARVPLSVVDEFEELQRELGMRKTEVWFASVPPTTLAMARNLPVWNEIEESGRYFTTVLAAAHAYLAARSLGGP